MEGKVKVGVIGVGNIFNQYMKGLRAFDILEVVACADLDFARAEARAAEFGIPRAYRPDELLADPEIQIVVNLTVPLAHADVTMSALAAGKHVYSEKPLAISREDGFRIMDTAHQLGLRVGCAPDTFLGGGLQTCRKLIDDGVIGTPVAATAFMMSRGPESWHPNPEFFYKIGGGPMFDMGPYYLTALIHLLGPVKRVVGSVRTSFPERIATSKERNGQRIQVDVHTHVAGLLDFAAGAVGTIITSFDVWSAQLPRIEIYGSEGTLSVPDPNIFGGTVSVRLGAQKEWEPEPLTHDASVVRGLGVGDMAYGIVYGRPHRASGDLANHVLDIMHAIHDSSIQERHIYPQSMVERPAPLPPGLPAGVLDTGAVNV